MAADIRGIRISMLINQAGYTRLENEGIRYGHGISRPVNKKMTAGLLSFSNKEVTDAARKNRQRRMPIQGIAILISIKKSNYLIWHK
jgi:hypothetical protein